MTNEDDNLTLAYMTGYQKAVEDYRARTCENCKHGEYEKNIDSIYCGFVNYCGSDYMDKDFGCNNFERKEDE